MIDQERERSRAISILKEYAENYGPNALHLLDQCDSLFKLSPTTYKTVVRMIRCWAEALHRVGTDVRAEDCEDDSSRIARLVKVAASTYRLRVKGKVPEVPGTTDVYYGPLLDPSSGPNSKRGFLVGPNSSAVERGIALFHDLHWWGLQFLAHDQEVLSHELWTLLYGSTVFMDLRFRKRVYVIPFPELEPMFDNVLALTNIIVTDKQTERDQWYGQ